MNDVRMFADLEGMSESAAGYIADAISNAAGRNGGVCFIALPGGNSSRRLYALLSSPVISREVPWGSLRVFFSDERCVSPESGESNYALANSNLLSKVPVPEGHVFRIPGEGPDHEESARLYEAVIREELLKSGRESFDIMILGAGADGHTASLFPGSPALDEKSRWVLYTRGGPELRTRDRITLTLPIINSSGKVVFIVSGNEKGPVLSRILSAAGPDKSLPASMVHGTGETVWFIDSEGFNA
jgi:6-phosphogluconolactonase